MRFGGPQSSSNTTTTSSSSSARARGVSTTSSTTTSVRRVVRSSVENRLRELPAEGTRGGGGVSGSVDCLVIQGEARAVRGNDGRCGKCSVLTNSLTNKCQGCGAVLLQRGSTAPPGISATAQRANSITTTTTASTRNYACNSSTDTPPGVSPPPVLTEAFLASKEEEDVVVVSASPNEVDRRTIGTARSYADSAVSTASSITVDKVVELEAKLGKDLRWNDEFTGVMLTAEDLANLRDKETLEFLASMSTLLSKYYSPGDGTAAPNNDDADKEDVAGTFITALDAEGGRHTVHVGPDKTLSIPVQQPDICSSPMSSRSSVISGFEGTGASMVARSDCVRMSLTSAALGDDDGDDYADDAQTVVTEFGAARSEADDSMALGSVVGGPSPERPPRGGANRTYMRRVPSGDVNSKRPARLKKYTAKELGFGDDADDGEVVKSKQKKEVPSYMKATASQKSKKKRGKQQDAEPDQEQSVLKSKEDIDGPDGAAAATTTKPKKKVVVKTAEEMDGHERRNAELGSKAKFYTLTEEEDKRVQAIMDDEQRFAEEQPEALAGEGYRVESGDLEKMKEVDEALSKLRPDWERLTQGAGGSSEQQSRSIRSRATTAAAPAAAAANYIAEMREERETKNLITNINERLSKIHNQTEQLFTPPFVFNSQYELEAEPEAWQWPEDVPCVSKLELHKLIMDACAEQGVDPPEGHLEGGANPAVLMMPSDYADYDFAEEEEKDNHHTNGVRNMGMAVE
eukprot:PhM_4_TR454/c0_g1_i1/m.31185